MNSVQKLTDAFYKLGPVERVRFLESIGVNCKMDTVELSGAPSPEWWNNPDTSPYDDPDLVFTHIEPSSESSAVLNASEPIEVDPSELEPMPNDRLGSYQDRPRSQSPTNQDAEHIEQLKPIAEREGMTWDSDTRFVLYHMRPEWADLEEPIPKGQHLMVIDVVSDFFTMRARYDRSELIDFYRDSLIVYYYILWWNRTQPTRLCFKPDFPNRLEYATDYVRFVGATYIVQDEGDGEKARWTLDWFAKWVNQEHEALDWWAAHYANVEKTARDALDNLSSIIGYRLPLFIFQMTWEAGAAARTGDGKVPKDEYEQCSTVHPILLTPNEHKHGDNRPYDPWANGEDGRFKDNVDLYYAAVECIRGYSKEHADEDWWEGIKQQSRELKRLIAKDSLAINTVDFAISLIQEYQEAQRAAIQASKQATDEDGIKKAESDIDKFSKILGPLFVTCETVARKMDKYNPRDGKPFSAEHLVKIYRKAGGMINAPRNMTIR